MKRAIRDNLIDMRTESDGEFHLAIKKQIINR